MTENKRDMSVRNARKRRTKRKTKLNETIMHQIEPLIIVYKDGSSTYRFHKEKLKLKPEEKEFLILKKNLGKG